MSWITLGLIRDRTFASQNPSSREQSLWATARPSQVCPPSWSLGWKDTTFPFSVSFYLDVTQNLGMFFWYFGLLYFLSKVPLPTMLLPEVDTGLNSRTSFLCTSILHLQAVAETDSSPALGVLLFNSKIVLELKNKTVLGFRTAYKLLNNEA